MAKITELPLEALLTILRSVYPRDLASLSLCCKNLYKAINDNYLLYRDVYLQHWDKPANKPFEVGNHWKSNLQTFTRMLSILQSKSLEIKVCVRRKDRHFALWLTSEMSFIAEAISEFLKASSLDDDDGSQNAKVLAGMFQDKLNQSAFLHRSSTFKWAESYRKEGRELRSSRTRSPADMLSAKLHCLHGYPNNEACHTERDYIYPFAASKVYDLRNYTRANGWGPFKDDGSMEVDWEKLESVMLVLGYNIQQKKTFLSGIMWDLWTAPFNGAFPNSYRPRKSALDHFRNPKRAQKQDEAAEVQDIDDPYDLSGLWLRIICFVDYSELFAYNFDSVSPPPGEPRMPLDTEEATRMIIMQMQATEVEPQEDTDGKRLPIVHFRGTSRPVVDYGDPNAYLNMRGSVRQTKEGEIHWTTFSVWQGEERWRSEGIQVGGPRSGRGVFGNWFDKDYNPEGPAGPTAFWKITDSEIDPKVEVDND